MRYLAIGFGGTAPAGWMEARPPRRWDRVRAGSRWSNSMTEEPAEGTRPETANALKDHAAAAIERIAARVALTRDIFAAAVALSGIYEVQAAEVALQRSRRPDVRAFARRMIDEHADLSAKLRSCVGGTNARQSPPEKPDPLHQVLIDDLKGASDEDFDGRYIAQQQAMHSSAVALMKNYRAHGDDEGLRKLAELAQPVLEKHLDAARELGA